ncbi:unnamed protein product [marine sediment metagenome]|uniref:AN1-type domain-containing protein n=1 Tax=marine sediment metagenome TaxID=412755 RepID=X0YI85_9ZZZZ
MGDEEMKCVVCKKEVYLPYRCSYCGQIFCDKHRLPENHMCPGLPKRGWENRKNVFHPYGRSSIFQPAPSPLQPKNANEPVDKRVDAKDFIKSKSPPKPVHKIKGLTYSVVLILISLSLIVVWDQSYNLGVASRLEEGTIQGLSLGEDLGASAGYNAGYYEGVGEGNNEGYELGLIEGNEEGYIHGFSDGKTTGYSVGYDSGYSLGYSQGLFEGNLTGFTFTYEKGIGDIADRRFNVTDVTYYAVKRFLRTDRTDSKKYTSNFVCFDFAIAVKKNAFERGIRCYYVRLVFTEPPGHAIVAFNTTDRGLVFFESQSDEEMDVDIGVRYWRDNIRVSKLDSDRSCTETCQPYHIVHQVQ